jgi:hypothetical protein
MIARLYFLTILAVAGILVSHSHAQDTETYELPPVNYSKTKPQDVITLLQAELASGQFKLGGTDREVVQSLLGILHIPVASQMLVFSKTSFQKDIISPEHPRALFYTDNRYVGWVPGGLVEIAAIDPILGPVFYSFDPRGLSEKKPPQFPRDDECMSCHGGEFVRGIPGVFSRTLYADKDGQPIFRRGSEVVDYKTPFSERWGGWYVTGTHGSTLHRGNVVASEVGDQLVFDPALGANITNLSKFFNTGDYLTNSSDIVSLLVFEHQTGMQNTLTRAGLNCRHMLEYQKDLIAALKPVPDPDGLCFDSVRSVFDDSAAEVVDALLFKDEAPLPKVIGGSAAFQKGFSANAPRDRNGNSLKDLLLSEHLFKNRCSYLIYSDSFLSLPQQLKSRIYTRLSKALNLEQPDPRYAYIDRAERQRIATILQETHPEFSSHLSACK